MLNSVLQRFLQDSEQAKRDFLWKVAGNLGMAEGNLYLIPLGQFPAEALGRDRDTQILELRGVEPVRQSLNVLSDFCKTPASFLDVIMGLRVSIQKTGSIDPIRSTTMQSVD